MVKKKNNVISAIISTAMIVLCGCSSVSNAKEGTVSGSIQSVKDKTITIKVGTLDENGKLTLTDQEEKFTIDDSTQYLNSSNAATVNVQDSTGQGQPSMSSDGKGPGSSAAPSDNGGSTQTPPSMPSGGQAPSGSAAPNDNNGSTQTPPSMPSDGQGPSGSAAPGGNDNFNQAQPSIPAASNAPAASSTQATAEAVSLDSLSSGTNISAVINSSGIATTITIISGEASTSTSSSSILGSWNMGGTDASKVEGNDYDYQAALYIVSDDIDTSKSSTDQISGGSYDDSTAEGISISDSTSGQNGILIDNRTYAIKNVKINLLTDADGTDTCDFSGKGSAIAVFGSNANATVEDSTIHTSGVATMPVFADNGATITLKKCTLQSDGGTLYKAYMNTPEQTLMVAPPWILGIMGTSRCSNMMGTNTTSNFVDCTTSAGAWAVLSTDAGNNMVLNIYNTSLTLDNKDESQKLLQEEGGEISETKDNPYTVNYGTGYGTYAIGNAVETFAGATLNVGTYATIFTGGSAVYTSLVKGQKYTLQNASGNSSYEYTASEDKATTINSDTFGFMAHQSSNKIEIKNGTTVNSGYATFLVKTGSSNENLTSTIDNSTLNNGGVLIQVMDNDDATNGGMMSTDDAANTNGGSKNFKSVHSEDAGFKTNTASADSSKQDFTFTNGTYSGNIYNASGSDGLNASALNVTLGSGAVLNGAAASTSAVHCTYDGSVSLRNNGGKAFDNAADAADFAAQYQNTSFSINEYYDIGQVANMVYSNGGNAVNINMSDDAVWNVTSTSLISSLTISGNAKVVIPTGTTLTVNGTSYTGCTLTADNFK